MQHLVANFGFEIVPLELPLVEPQADSIEAVAESKAAQAVRLANQPVMVEDSGFYIDELRGFPGAYTRYVLDTIGAAGLLRLAAPLHSRACRFISALSYLTPAGLSKTFVDQTGTGHLDTEIDQTSCPEAWSDLWRIFIPEKLSKPLSALTPDERAALMRTWQDESVYIQFANWLSQNP
jgi:XTP/dITP diphosphohydrolase